MLSVNAYPFIDTEFLVVILVWKYLIKDYLVASTVNHPSKCC